ncbi:MAG TPA: hypothetical protein PL110_07685 [Candidatus Eremiobacteraeota bacterium]|nr:MAG: hypothetical protein BWY64_00812 [bacterium ADurb.Bin363]HPZ07978.1 hypothetical protein [Candidatus Eremiobacteraeota bacterium]
MKILTFEEILEVVKKLTPREREILEKELAIMRLGKEFKFITDKLEKRRISRKERDTQDVRFSKDATG